VRTNRLAAIFAILVTCGSGAVARGGENPIPASPPADRYAGMSRHSPFALATAAPVVPPAGPSFAANWYIAGIARDGDTDFVTIKSRDATIQFSLRGKEAHQEQGVVLDQINWSDEPLKSTVSIRKGNELALLQFNEAIVHGPTGPAQQAAAPAGGTAQGSSKPGAQGLVKPAPQTFSLPPRPPAGTAANQVPPPNNAGIPVPHTAAAAPQASGEQAVETAVSIRRRIRPAGVPQN